MDAPQEALERQGEHVLQVSQGDVLVSRRAPLLADRAG